MLKQSRIVLVAISLCCVGTMAQAQVQPCPGFNPNNNVNLACEIPTATRTSGSLNLAPLPPTIAAQLSQLPIATAVSGSGLVFRGGIPTVATEGLGTILTQRGETLGRHKFFLSFTYQRFNFGSIDGVGLKNLQTVSQFTTAGITTYLQAKSRIDLKVDQFAALGSFGLTNRIDVSVIVPFSKVSLATSSSTTDYTTGFPPANFNPLTLAGSATGLGDVTINLKANVLKLERTSIAIGDEVRFPTGDETNFLGTGAYGVKPYVVLSHRGRITPNVNLGYQWNGSSALFADPNTGAHLNLPSSFLYSGGADFLVVRRFTLTAEFLGQYVINGPRIAPGTVAIPGQGTFATVTPFKGSYAMDNAGAGFKINPFKGLLISANVMFKLDEGGLRSNVVPLGGISYRF